MHAARRNRNSKGAVMEAGHVVRKIFRLIILFIANIPTFVFFDLFLGYTEGAAGGMFGLTDKLVAFFENILGSAGLLPEAQHNSCARNYRRLVLCRLPPNVLSGNRSLKR